MSPQLHTPTQRFGVRLHLLSSEERPLKHWAPVHLHLGASHVNARIALLEEERLEAGGESFAQLVLESGIGVRRGDRFVVRDQSAQRTLGGGVVLDCAPPARYRRTARRLALLAAIHSGSPARVLSCTLESSGNGVDLRHFASEWSLDDYAAATLLPMAVVAEPIRPVGIRIEPVGRPGREVSCHPGRGAPNKVLCVRGRLFGD